MECDSLPDFDFERERFIKRSNTLREEMVTVFIIRTAIMIIISVMSSRSHNKNNDYGINLYYEPIIIKKTVITRGGTRKNF